MLVSDQLVALDPYEALRRQRTLTPRRGPDADESGVFVLKLNARHGVKYANDIDYEMTDDQHGAVPRRVTQYWRLSRSS